MIEHLETDSEARRTIVLSCTESEGTDWRKDSLKKIKQQRRKSFWKRRPNCVPTFPYRKVHESVVWLLASSRMSQLQVWIGMHMRRKMPIPTRWGWWSAQWEVEEKWCKRISCHSQGVYSIRLCVSRFSSEKNYSTERWKIGIKAHCQIHRGHVAPHKKFGKERVPREALIKSANFMTTIRARPGLRRGHKRKPRNKEDAPAQKHGTWRKNILQTRECWESYVLLSYWN